MAQCKSSMAMGLSHMAGPVTISTCKMCHEPPSWEQARMLKFEIYFHSEHAEGPLMHHSRPVQLNCGCHTILKFIKLTRC